MSGSPSHAPRVSAPRRTGARCCCRRRPARCSPTHDRTALRSLGSYRLKDFNEPEPISQVVVAGLPAQFPPLRTEVGPRGRRWPLLAAAGILVAGAIAGAVVVLTDDGSSGLSKIGPKSVGVIDPKTNSLVDEIPLGFKSSLIAAGEGSVWVVDPKGSTLWRIDPRTRDVRAVGIPGGADGVPIGIAVGGGAVWLEVRQKRRQVVYELSPDVGDLRRTIPFGGEANGSVLFKLQPLAFGGGAVWAIDSAEGLGGRRCTRLLAVGAVAAWAHSRNRGQGRCSTPARRESLRPGRWLGSRRGERERRAARPRVVRGGDRGGAAVL